MFPGLLHSQAASSLPTDFSFDCRHLPDKQKNPEPVWLGMQIPSLRWVREGQTFSAGCAEAMRTV
jgi:hypothetical protein